MSGEHTKLPRGRIVAVVIAVIVLVPVLFVVIGFWPGSTKDIEAVANKFQPGDGWRLESEQIEPPRLICLQADCNTMTRAWTLEKNITTEEFRDRIKSSPEFETLWRDTIECRLNKVITSGWQTICEVRGVINGMSVDLYAQADQSEDLEPRVVIRVEKR